MICFPVYSLCLCVCMCVDTILLHFRVSQTTKCCLLKNQHNFSWQNSALEQTEFSEAKDFRKKKKKKSQPSHRILPTWPSENLAQTLHLQLILLILTTKMLS